MTNESGVAVHSRTTFGSGGTQVKHRAMIADVLATYPRARDHGFAKAVAALAERVGAEEVETPTFRPDAYRLNEETCEIELHEVVRTSDIPERKREQLAWYWFEWECEDNNDWLPVLFVHREHYPVHRVDLTQWYYALLDSEIERGSQ